MNVQEDGAQRRIGDSTGTKIILTSCLIVMRLTSEQILESYYPPSRLRPSDITNRPLNDSNLVKRVRKVLDVCNTNFNIHFACGSGSDILDDKRSYCWEVFKGVRLDTRLSCLLKCGLKSEANVWNPASRFLARLPVLPSHLLDLDEPRFGTGSNPTHSNSWDEDYYLPHDDSSFDMIDTPEMAAQNLQVVRIINTNNVKIALQIAARLTKKEPFKEGHRMDFNDQLMRYIDLLTLLSEETFALDIYISVSKAERGSNTSNHFVQTLFDVRDFYDSDDNLRDHVM